MTKLFFKICFFSLVLITSCKEGKFSKEESIFFNYLKNENIKLSSNHLYVLLPQLACKSCVKSLVPILEEGEFDVENMTIITTSSKVANNSNLKEISVVLDQNKDLDYLDLNIFNLTYVEVKNSQIIDFSSIEAGDANRLNDVLKDYRR